MFESLEKEPIPGMLTDEQIEEIQETIDSIRGGLEDLELQLSRYRRKDQHGDRLINYAARDN